MFRYTDRLFNLVRPRKLLYIGIDGVAPRAKMNQQRSRRFRAAKEMDEKDSEEERLRNEWAAKGYNVDDADGGHSWDSNVITPGTPFMERMVDFLRYYIHHRQSTNPGWKDVMVVISDSNTPGEGEHKIMEFIRLQRQQRGYDPNTHHVIQGLDADLIMLALASHEPYFTILRENVSQKAKPPPGLDLQAKKKSGEFDEKAQAADIKQFEFLHVHILREYLEAEFNPRDVTYPQGFDLERVIDDFVFLCFFAGNDFLPHLPSLDIREGGIETLISEYKQLMPSMGGYLTESGKVIIPRTEMIAARLGQLEDAVFADRQDKTERDQRNRKRRKMSAMETAARVKAAGMMQKMSDVDAGAAAGVAKMAPPILSTHHGTVKSITGFGCFVTCPGYQKDGLVHVSRMAQHRVESPESMVAVGDKVWVKVTDVTDEGKVELSMKVMDQETGKEIATPEVVSDGTDFQGELKKAMDAKMENEDEEDDIKLHESGFKRRYYLKKFHVDIDLEPDFPRRVVQSYIEGLVWVLAYYYQGCASWSWFYPFHYAPFASDFTELSSLKLSFRRGEPYRPLEQLMAVLPPRSSHALPEAHAKLMLDPKSEIADFYPKDFAIDMNGARMAWMGIALMPFIDSDRLISAVRPLEEHLTEQEKYRNSIHPNRVFVSSTHPNFEAMSRLAASVPATIKMQEAVARRVPLDAAQTKGIYGSMAPVPNAVKTGVALEPPSKDCPALASNNSVAAYFFNPAFVPHTPKLLPNVKMPPAVLTPADLSESKNFVFGRRGRGRGGRGGGRGGGSRGGTRAAGPPAGWAPNLQAVGFMGGQQQQQTPAQRMIMHGIGNSGSMMYQHQQAGAYPSQQAQHMGIGGMQPGAAPGWGAYGGAGGGYVGQYQQVQQPMMMGWSGAQDGYGQQQQQGQWGGGAGAQGGGQWATGGQMQAQYQQQLQWGGGNGNGSANQQAATALQQQLHGQGNSANADAAARLRAQLGGRN